MYSEPRIWVGFFMLSLAAVRVGQITKGIVTRARSCSLRLGWPASWMRDPLADLSPKLRETVRGRAVQFRVFAQHNTALLGSIVSCFPTLLIGGRNIMGGAAYLTLQQEIGFSLGFFLLVVGSVLPFVVNERTYLRGFFLVMITITIYSSPFVDGDREMIMHFATASQTMCLVVGFQADFRVVFPCNLVHDIIQVTAFALADPGETQVSVRGFAEQVMYAFSTKMLIMWIVDRLLVMSLLGEVQAKQEKGLRVAVFSLLNKMCDVVFELDEKHRMTQHEPRLAQVLLHGNAGRSLEGAMLQEFVPQEEEKDELTQRLSMIPSDEQDVAGMFHVTVKDGMGSRLRMQCFHVAYESVGNARHHIVGLLEDADAKMLEPMAPLGQVSASVQERLAHRRAMHTAPTEIDSRSGTNSSLSSAPVDPHEDLEKVVSLQVRIKERRLVVVWASDLFHSKFGMTLPGSSDFLEWLPKDRERFLQKISIHMNKVFTGRAEPGVIEFGTAMVVPIGNHLAHRRHKERPRSIVGVFPADGAGDWAMGKSPKEDYRITILIGQREKPPASSAGIEAL